MAENRLFWVSVYDKEGVRLLHKGMTQTAFNSFCCKQGIEFEDGSKEAIDSQGRKVVVSDRLDRDAFSVSRKGGSGRLGGR